MPRLAWVLLLCVALAGCGKSTEEKYKEGFLPIDRGLAVLGSDVGEGLRGADDRTLPREFAAYARRLGDLRERLDDLEAPERLSSDHEALLAATGDVHSALNDIARAARRGDAAAARDAATRLVRDGVRLDEARRELERAVRTL